MRFCIVTPTHISLDPRVVKEADALHAAGHDVRVVAFDVRPELAARDDGLLRSRRWRLQRLAVGRGSARGCVRWVRDGIVQRAVRAVVDATGTGVPALADRAVSRHHGLLVAACAAEPADVIVAHNLPALPAAVRAARAVGARAAFDLEDLHSAELSDDPGVRRQKRLVAATERRYLPRCDLLVASSSGIADEVVALYGVRRPCVVLNVFPAADRSRSDVPRERQGSEPSLYWYSHVIGPDRGLEEALAAVAMLPIPVRLHLRGLVEPGYGERLRATIEAHGLGARVHFLPHAPPDHLVALAAEHDIGLALEQPVSRNRELCATNKIFTYLVAGLAVVATDTIGQRGIVEATRGAGVLYPAGQPARLAAALGSILAEPGALERARARARAAADDRFSWEHERHKLVGCLTGAPPDDAADAIAEAAASAVPASAAESVR